jgi:Secretion system C-terminal sorting domain
MIKKRRDIVNLQTMLVELRRLVFAIACYCMVMVLSIETATAQATYPPNDPSGKIVDLTMQFDTVNQVYQVFGKPNFTTTAVVGNQFKIANGSIISIVVPDTLSDAPFVVTSAPGSGGIWDDAQQVLAPGAMPKKDFHAVVVTANNTNILWQSGIPKLLFSFQLETADCSAGNIRLFINATDPKDTANGMQFLDFENYIGKASVINSQYYQKNYDSAAYTNLNGFNCNYPSAPLGVSFTNFTANAKPNCEAALNWTMNATTPIKHFEVMSSLDNNTFTQIAEVQANGASSGTFSALDTRSIKGNIYYRIDVVYADGHKENSFTKAVRTSCDIEHSASLYPNPASAEVKFDVYVANAATKDNIIIEVFDATSKLVMQSEAKMVNGLASASLNVKHLANGTYMVKYYNTNRQYQGIVKFVKSID